MIKCHCLLNGMNPMSNSQNLSALLSSLKKSTFVYVVDFLYNDFAAATLADVLITARLG